ncbi:unnamed protein product [Cladocopium goreaui]|uniref:NADPH-dependent diflavin oxidoreductase 1 n=1 Tax=Cladocopium goreaui TaxID=2562237 RepID=A0A9P1FW23_9DINO|nr:unnamed protein product [Cladocopium goreaui]
MSLEDRFHPLAPAHPPAAPVADSLLVPRLDDALGNFRGYGKRERRRREQTRKLREFLKKHRFPDVNEPQQFHVTFCILPRRKEELYPIHMAARLGDYEMLRLLQKAGADSSQKTSLGRSALQLVDQQTEQFEHISLLLNGQLMPAPARMLKSLSASDDSISS